MYAFKNTHLKAKAIPFKNSIERIKITGREIRKGMEVVTDYKNNYIHSFPKETARKPHVKFNGYKNSGANKTFENFKCNSCDTEFRISALEDIQWAVCIRCGGVNIDELNRKEEREFENNIR